MAYLLNVKLTSKWPNWDLSTKFCCRQDLCSYILLPTLEKLHLITNKMIFFQKYININKTVISKCLLYAMHQTTCLCELTNLINRWENWAYRGSITCSWFSMLFLVFSLLCSNAAVPSISCTLELSREVLKNQFIGIS